MPRCSGRRRSSSSNLEQQRSTVNKGNRGEQTKREKSQGSGVSVVPSRVRETKIKFGFLWVWIHINRQGKEMEKTLVSYLGQITINLVAHKIQNNFNNNNNFINLT